MGEKQKLFQQIAMLEQIQSQMSEDIANLKRENEILSRFRYQNVTLQTGQVLPACFMDETFTIWTKFQHLIIKCERKCFKNGFEAVESGFDTGLLLNFIERLVQMLQLVEKSVGSKRDKTERKAHVDIIEWISEDSLKLSQIPELQSLGGGS